LKKVAPLNDAKLHQWYSANYSLGPKRGQQRHRQSHCPLARRARRRGLPGTRRRELLDDAAKQVHALGSRGHACPADLTNDDDVRGLGERFQKEFGHVNILVAHHAVRSESGAAGAAGLVQFLAALLRPFCRLPGAGKSVCPVRSGGQNIRELAMRHIVGPAGCNRERRNVVMKDWHIRKERQVGSSRAVIPGSRKFDSLGFRLQR